MSEDSSPKDGDSCFVSIVIILLTAFIVVFVTYSAYLFIDLTRVPNIAGIHVTKNLKMAASRASGNLYSDEEKGIKDWIVYTDVNNGFEIKYPNDFALQKGSGGQQHFLTIRKANENLKGERSSLSSVMYFDVINVESRSIKDELSSRGVGWSEEWKQQWIGGKPGLRTGKFVDNSGVIKELVVWQLGGRMIVLEENCFNTNHDEAQKMFEKIVSEFKFI